MMSFWERLERLLASHEVVIGRPRGTVHPRFPDMVYPLDYGYLKGTCGGDGNEIDVWVGSGTPRRLVGVACTVDSMEKVAEVKLLLGSNDLEMDTIRRFLDENDHVLCIIVRRGERG